MGLIIQNLEIKRNKHKSFTGEDNFKKIITTLSLHSLLNYEILEQFIDTNQSCEHIEDLT